MKHKIWDNFISVISLVIPSGAVMPHRQQAAQDTLVEVRLKTSPGDNSAFEEARNVYTADPVSVDGIGHIGGSVYAVAVVGHYAYVGEGSGLTMLDITNPNALAVVGRSGLFSGLVQEVSVVGNYTCVADDFSCLWIIDVIDVTRLVKIGQYVTPSATSGVALLGNYAYAIGPSSLWIVDVSDPTNPSEVGSCDTSKTGSAVTVAGGHAYVADGYSGLRIIDVADPANPSCVGFYDTSFDGTSVALTEDYAHLADWEGGLIILNTRGWIGYFCH